MKKHELFWHKDKAGKFWSLNPDDPAFYDEERNSYCINLEKKGRVEPRHYEHVHQKATEIGTLFNLKKATDPVVVDRVIESVDKAVRKYYGRGQ